MPTHDRSRCVRIRRHTLNGIDVIEVQDNGLGIALAGAQNGVGHLGGYWKKYERQSKKDKRILHGKEGHPSHRSAGDRHPFVQFGETAAGLFAEASRQSQRFLCPVCELRNRLAGLMLALSMDPIIS
jgi:hypothetical protein